MSIKRVRISDLQLGNDLRGLYTIGVKTIDGRQTSVKVGLEFVKDAADNANAAAESAKKTEEEIKTAEALRVQAESSRASSEAIRVSNESGRVYAESVRVSNETARKSAETGRVNAETSRVSAETARKTAETNRETAESTRVSNENARKTAETARINAETLRESNESARKVAETARANAESIRLTNETARVNAENIRIANEEARVSEYGAIIAATNKAKDDAILATKDTKEATAKAIAETENLAGMKADVVAATNNANEKAILANTAAGNANAAASNANEKAGLANTAAANANEKAGLANTAANNANEATTHANTATGKANEAATSANNAAKSANDAATAANNAAGSVDAAKTNAENAAIAANNAATSANTATGKANEATTNANAAAVAANDKAGIANTAAISANAAATNANEKAGLANVAATNANTAAASAKEISENPPKVSATGTWLLYNLAQHKYVDSGLSARAHSPYIQGGNWWVYNDDQNAYYNTGIPVSSTYELTKAKVEAVLTGTISSHAHLYAASTTAGGPATSANKVNAALTISLNGSSQGAWDGSAAKTINITPAAIGAAAASHAHNYLPFQDTRSAEYAPYNAAIPKGLTASHLKGNSIDGLNDGGTYHSSVYIHPWGDSSGGAAHNLAFTDNGNMWLRSGASAWGAWKKFLNSSNYNEYAPTKAGGGASGTWAIGITGNAATASSAAACTGNAATATKLQAARTIIIGSTGKSFDGSGNISWSLAEIGVPSTTGANASGTWGINILGQANAVALSGIADSTTYGSYAGIIQNSTTGPNNGTWYNKLKILHNNAEGYFTELAMPFTDSNQRMYYRSMISGAAQAWKAIAYTSDIPSSLPASDVYAWAKAATKPSYTAAEVGAAAASHTHNYAGSSTAGGAATTALACTGNAATATKLATARKITLTGPVSGETTFDGSGNVTLATLLNSSTLKDISGWTGYLPLTSSRITAQITENVVAKNKLYVLVFTRTLALGWLYGESVGSIADPNSVSMLVSSGTWNNLITGMSAYNRTFEINFTSTPANFGGLYKIYSIDL
ncbi:hypothetical protein [Bacteroides sp. 51]|uniref:hypothetical protein n=1 Tax=Bacteroides sp. 51 TaxID=2302938 RepID=UPI0013D4BF56|nr:hypothetical protein [Bacteroides sp. 51]NDV81323.1 hypothetical protein [Bacteroides sp. 51]